jgi:TPP-dependent indolepyruvate ferredoxin oxidoreductase alpha subunit
VQPILGRLERSALVTRPELALRYARANRLNRATGDADARVGVVAAGAPWLDTIEALRLCGVDLADANCGVRVLKLGMISPLDHEEIRSFAAGLDVIVVVEEKRAFIELGVKDALYGLSDAPRVVGRRGLDNAPLLRPDNDLPPELIAAAVAPILDQFGVPTTPLPASPRPSVPTLLPMLNRTPYFCSGCPTTAPRRCPHEHADEPERAEEEEQGSGTTGFGGDRGDPFPYLAGEAEPEEQQQQAGPGAAKAGEGELLQNGDRAARTSLGTFPHVHSPAVGRWWQ